jgi:hypothetical protein
MRTHPQFPRLLIHDDDELGAALGGRVAGRSLVHEWPLARTEDVRLADGRRYAYKAQLPPTVEREFYTSARSSLLVPFRDLGQEAATSFLATEWVDAPTMHTAPLSDDEFLSEARAVVEELGDLGGIVPSYLDLSTCDALALAAETTAARLSSLIAAGRFSTVQADAPARVAAWARSAAVVDAATASPRLTHGDLSPEEVFLTGDGRRMIDWQRPVRGPADLDLVSLLRYRRIDPLRHVDAEVVQLSWFVLLHWAAVAQTDLLPGLPPAIPEGWALAALPHILD